MRLSRWLLATILVLGVVGAAGCPAEEPEEDVTREEPTREETPPVEAPEAVEPTVTVQPPVSVTDGRVTIDSVEATSQGWVVIHADENDAPAADLGYTAVQPGTNEDVVVELERAPEPGERMWAMLHLETGVIGQYEFPDGDPPVTVDGEVVMTQVEVGR
ncbi:MAG: hypothetical protein IBX62_08465 [Coriobacteriia bacterium]|nr:hypothetical protein [Coriobacteriia bacterium]